MRIIPRLDIKNNTVVKGIHLEGLRVVGDPAELSRTYYAQGADEILYMDAVASLYERNSLKDIIRVVSEDVFIPLTVGGGIRSIDDIRGILRAGADKVAINTAAIRRPGFIREASQIFGSQCIAVSIEAKRIGDGVWEAYVDTGRETTGIDVVEWAQEVVRLGAGEIIVTSIDREGMKNGFEIDLVERIMNLVSVPVVACGGCGRPEHVEALLNRASVSGVACASIFHYQLSDVTALKMHLGKAGIPVRAVGKNL
ncbi:MAG: imidazole glycerol phosphate synthase subunit HisF [Candidatus Omnitrophica bacterium]|nr:imidazole glycerol phosphate synthase subunit HisF [Candidatus Omnitrophota bacterium]